MASIITLKQATEDDCRFLFDLRNYPVVRKMSFNSDELVFEKHETWFRSLLKNVDKRIFIAFDDSKKIGMVRFDKNDGDGRSATISVAVSPDIHGKGYGTTILKDGCRMYLSSEDDVHYLIAEIKKANIASVKVFGKAGFVPHKESGENLKMRLNRN